MTTYKRSYEASLARYNARKRELQASMLEYSEHMRHIHSHRNSSPLRDSTESSLEVRRRGQLATRHSDPAFITKRLRHGRHEHNRPSSLDEKELQLNANVHVAPKRDTKSERPPVTVPTALPPLTEPPLNDPPNTPDTSRKSNVCVSFVSASDLYDIVDFGPSSKSPRNGSTRIVNVRDGFKLIEDIDLQHRRERRMAWEKQSNASGKDKENSPSKPDVNVEILTGKRIHPQAINSNSKYSNKNTTLPKLRSIPEEGEKAKFVVTSDTEEIFPLNLLLEQAAASHLKTQQKLRTRPKRAKRMQLHKSSLDVITEDNGTFVSTADKQSSSRQISEQSSDDQSVDPKSSCSNLSTNLKHFSKMQNKSSFSSDDSRTETGARSSKCDIPDSIGQQKLTNSSLTDDTNRKTILKRASKDGNESSREGKQLNKLVVTNNGYSSLPWEKDNLVDPRHKVKHVTFDTSISRVKARRKMKKLVFLQDHPEQSYRPET